MSTMSICLPNLHLSVFSPFNPKSLSTLSICSPATMHDLYFSNVRNHLNLIKNQKTSIILIFLIRGTGNHQIQVNVVNVV